MSRDACRAALRATLCARRPICRICKVARAEIIMRPLRVLTFGFRAPSAFWRAAVAPPSTFAGGRQRRPKCAINSRRTGSPLPVPRLIVRARSLRPRARARAEVHWKTVCPLERSFCRASKPLSADHSFRRSVRARRQTQTRARAEDTEFRARANRKIYLSVCSFGRRPTSGQRLFVFLR